MRISPNPGRMSLLITWVHDPSVYSLEDVLDTLTDDDLLFLIGAHTSLTVARLAWAEYGRRHKFVEFTISCVRSDGQVDIHYNSRPAVVHEAPIFTVSPK